ncbi:hypothetical protein BOX15_Mlig027014g2, partial [Macrostomum lignano]
MGCSPSSFSGAKKGRSRKRMKKKEIADPSLESEATAETVMECQRLMTAAAAA